MPPPRDSCITALNWKPALRSWVSAAPNRSAACASSPVRAYTKAMASRTGSASVELSADGAALRVVPVHQDTLGETDGRLVIPASGLTIGDELVQALRDADRRQSWALPKTRPWSIQVLPFRSL